MARLALAAALLATSATADAAVIYASNPAVSSYGSNGRYPVTLAQFDPVLGTLTAIDVAASVDFRLLINSYGWNDDASVPASLNLNYSLLTDTTVFVGLGSMSFQMANDAPNVDIATGTGVLVPPLTRSVAFSLQSDQFSGFIGRGTIEAGGHSDYLFDGIVSGADHVSPIETIDHATTTSLRVAYTYTPTAAAVPEPVSWAMMLGGFGAIGIAFRRRKAALSAAGSSATAPAIEPRRGTL